MHGDIPPQPQPIHPSRRLAVPRQPQLIPRYPYRMRTTNLEKSASLGHWTDGLVRPPPPISPRSRTPSQDATSNDPTSTGLRGSQGSKNSEATIRSATRSLSSLIPRRSSLSERIMAAQRTHGHPQGSDFAVGPSAAHLFPFADHPSQSTIFVNSDESWRPITVPFHGSKVASSSTVKTSPPPVPQAQQTHSSGYVDGSPARTHP